MSGFAVAAFLHLSSPSHAARRTRATRPAADHPMRTAQTTNPMIVMVGSRRTAIDWHPEICRPSRAGSAHPHRHKPGRALRAGRARPTLVVPAPRARYHLLVRTARKGSGDGHRAGSISGTGAVPRGVPGRDHQRLPATVARTPPRHPCTRPAGRHVGGRAPSAGPDRLRPATQPRIPRGPWQVSHVPGGCATGSGRTPGAVSEAPAGPDPIYHPDPDPWPRDRHPLATTTRNRPVDRTDAMAPLTAAPGSRTRTAPRPARCRTALDGIASRGRLSADIEPSEVSQSDSRLISIDYKSESILLLEIIRGIGGPSISGGCRVGWSVWWSRVRRRALSGMGRNIVPTIQ